MYKEFNIYLDDLKEDVQKRFLEAVGLNDVSEIKWDTKTTPIAILCYESDDE